MDGWTSTSRVESSRVESSRDCNVFSLEGRGGGGGKKKGSPKKKKKKEAADSRVLFRNKGGLERHLSLKCEVPK